MTQDLSQAVFIVNPEVSKSVERNIRAWAQLERNAAQRKYESRRNSK